MSEYLLILCPPRHLSRRLHRFPYSVPLWTYGVHGLAHRRSAWDGLAVWRCRYQFLRAGWRFCRRTVSAQPSVRQKLYARAERLSMLCQLRQAEITSFVERAEGTPRS